MTNTINSTSSTTDYNSMKRLAIADGYASMGHPIDPADAPFMDTADIDSMFASATPTEIYNYWYRYTMDHIAASAQHAC